MLSQRHAAMLITPLRDGHFADADAYVISARLRQHFDDAIRCR